MSLTIEDYLKSIYYDISNSAGLSSVQKLYEKAKRIYPHVKRSLIKEWLSSQLTYTLHKPVRRKFVRNKIIVSAVDEQWQADLADMSQASAENEGVKYLLTVIDVLSKYAWVQPLKNKKPASIIAAFSIIFKERQPYFLQTDKGKEFDNTKFRQFLKTHGVRLFFSQNEDVKCAIVERFNRTLKGKIFKHFTATLSKAYLKQLQDMVSAYNSSTHRSTKLKPREVTIDNQQEAFKNIYKTDSLRTLIKQRNLPRLLVGDKVRLSKHRGIFDKGYLPLWTEEVFTIHAVQRKHKKPVYTLKDSQGEIIVGTFYNEELQKVKITASSIFRIEKIVKSRKRGRRTEYLVKWLGYPASENSWVNAKELISST